jgi:hypothetical protein
MNGIRLSNNDTVLFVEKHYEMKIFLFTSINKTAIHEVHMKRIKNKHISVIYNIDILIIKPTRCANFSNLFLEYNSTCFGQFLCPSSGV